MAKAKTAHSTERKTASKKIESEESDRRLAKAYTDIESAINEIANMAGVNSSLMEATASNPTGTKIHKEVTLVPDQKMERILFSAYHLERMIVDFKEKYYAVLDADAMRKESAHVA